MDEVTLKLTKKEIEHLWFFMNDSIRRRIAEGFGKNASIYDIVLLLHTYSKIEDARTEVLGNE